MEVYCNSAMTNETLKSDANGNIRGMKSFQERNYFRAYSAEREREGDERGRGWSIREHNSRKNVIPKQLVIRRSTNNRFVSRRTHSRDIFAHVCACVLRMCTFPPARCNPTIQFSGDIITRYIIPIRVANISADHEDRFRSERYEIKK